MLSDLVGLILCAPPVLGLLVWREHADRRQRAADLVHADVHAGATRALAGESLLAIRVEAPTAWRPSHVQLTQLVSARLLAVITPGEEAAALASLAGLAAIARAAQAAARRRASPGSHRRHPSQNVASEIGVLGPAAA